jgi:hypothetical protein
LFPSFLPSLFSSFLPVFSDISSLRSTRWIHLLAESKILTSARLSQICPLGFPAYKDVQILDLYP